MPSVYEPRVAGTATVRSRIKMTMRPARPAMTKTPAAHTRRRSVRESARKKFRRKDIKRVRSGLTDHQLGDGKRREGDGKHDSGPEGDPFQAAPGLVHAAIAPAAEDTGHAGRAFLDKDQGDEEPRDHNLGDCQDGVGLAHVRVAKWNTTLMALTII